MFQRVRTVKWISLVNLVAEREVVPEMLQDHASAGELASLGTDRCSSPAIPARWLSGRGWRWCVSAWGRPARRPGW